MKKLLITLLAVVVTRGAWATVGDDNATSKLYVDTTVATRQDAVDANTTNTVMTYTDTPGTVGTKGIYDATSSYAEQQNALVPADIANAAIMNAINMEFTCAEYNPNDATDCWKWSIHAKEVPDTYVRLDSVTNTSNTGFDTGIGIDIDDFEFELRVKPSLGSWYILQARNNNDNAIWGISGSISGNTIVFGWAGNQWLIRNSEIIRQTDKVYYIRATAKDGVATLYVKNETDNIEDTETATYTFVPTASHIGLFRNFRGNAAPAGNSVYMARIRKGGQLVMDYIPAMYNNTVGFYDTVSQTFKTPTSGSVTADSGVTYLPSGQ